MVVAPSTSRTPAPDPVFVVAGGPGQGAAELATVVLPRLETIRRQRDIVFVDLRGTGASGRLACELAQAQRLDHQLAPRFDAAELNDCLEQLEVDMRHYTSRDAADDLEAVRVALGYGAINFFAVSYGTRQVLLYLRHHGEQVRSAILDGPVPLDVGIVHSAPMSAEAALRARLRDCRDDSACGAAYPGLERQLREVLRDLEAASDGYRLNHPRTGEPLRIEISPVGFLGVLRGALYSSELAALLPLVISRAHAGDFGPTAALAERLMAGSRTVSTGAYLAATCAEELGRPRPDAAMLDALEFFGTQEIDRLERACDLWPHAELDADDWRPVVSDAPVLLLSGGYDPITPPELGERVAARLPRARHLVAAGGSHGVWTRGCAPALMASFIAEPDPEGIDGDCLGEIKARGFFLSAAGSRPMPAAAAKLGELVERRDAPAAPAPP